MGALCVTQKWDSSGREGLPSQRITGRTGKENQTAICLGL